MQAPIFGRAKDSAGCYRFRRHSKTIRAASLNRDEPSWIQRMTENFFPRRRLQEGRTRLARAFPNRGIQDSGTAVYQVPQSTHSTLETVVKGVNCKRYRSDPVASPYSTGIIVLIPAGIHPLETSCIEIKTGISRETGSNSRPPIEFTQYFILILAICCGSSVSFPRKSN